MCQRGDLQDSGFLLGSPRKEHQPPNEATFVLGKKPEVQLANQINRLGPPP